jgi:hypothetical protein
MKGVPTEVNGAEFTKGEHVSAYKDKLIIMKWKNEKDIFLINTTHDEMVPTKIQGEAQSSH